MRLVLNVYLDMHFNNGSFKQEIPLKKRGNFETDEMLLENEELLHMLIPLLRLVAW